jgi:hypothetical protein
MSFDYIYTVSNVQSHIKDLQKVVVVVVVVVIFIVG